MFKAISECQVLHPDPHDSSSSDDDDNDDDDEDNADDNVGEFGNLDDCDDNQENMAIDDDNTNERKNESGEGHSKGSNQQSQSNETMETYNICPRPFATYGLAHYPPPKLTDEEAKSVFGAFWNWAPSDGPPPHPLLSGKWLGEESSTDEEEEEETYEPIPLRRLGH